MCLIAPFFSWKGLSTKQGNSPKVNHSKQEFRRHIHLEMFKSMHLFMVHCSKELFWNSCFQQILYTTICLFFNSQPYGHLINTCMFTSCPGKLSIHFPFRKLCIKCGKPIRWFLSIALHNAYVLHTIFALSVHIYTKQKKFPSS